MCEIAFDELESLRLARMKVAALNKELIENKHVRLDAKKTRLENRPVGMVHRAYEHLSSATSGNVAASDLEKDIPNRAINVNSLVIGYSSQSEWYWTAEARKHYGQEELDMTRSYAVQQ